MDCTEPGHLPGAGRASSLGREMSGQPLNHELPHSDREFLIPAKHSSFSESALAFD
jgi:hypothetical protein